VDNEQPVPYIELSDEFIDLAATPSIDVSIGATDNVAVVALLLDQDGNPIPLTSGSATFTPPGPGLYTFVATATDAAGNVGTAARTLRVFDPADTTPPVISLASPAPGAIVTYLTDISGSVTDDNLEFYRLQVAPAGTDEWTTFFEGSTAVTAGLLGVLDPTLLQRDIYDLRVLAQDVNGQQSLLTLPISVEGQAVLGNFTLQFTDLSIPLAGIPIEIVRTYDTLDAARSGDFGYGWRLGFQEPRIRESVRVSPAEQAGAAALFSANPFRQGTRVYLTNPAGRRVGFTFDPTPEPGFLGTIWHPRFTADPGVFDVLSVEDIPLSQSATGVFSLYLVGFPYNPQEYSLTTKDQLTYRYDQFDGLLDVTDRNGVQLTYSATGIVSSVGQSIQFQRDDLGRLTQILDPAGNPLTYTYDAAGDLVTFTNQVGLGSSYTYLADPAHYLAEMSEECGCGAPFIRTEYDPSGRLINTTDALGHAAPQSYDLANNTEIVADREGHETTLVFDDRGNILSQTDPLGATTTVTYDAADNQTSITDPRNHTTTNTFDARGNLITSTDPFNRTWTYTYSDRNDPATIVDPLNRVSTYIYNANGNLQQFIDAGGHSLFIIPDSQGRPLQITDRTGLITTFAYGVGRNPTRITNHDGTFAEVQYGLLGQALEVTDEKGRTTTFTYDPSGRPTSVRDAENGLRRLVYDSENLVESIDPLGRITRYEYDAANRRIRTIDPLNGAMTTIYDGNGHVLSVTDPLNHTTTYAYRDDGMLDTVTDPLNHTLTYQYDAADNQTAVTDANGHHTTFEYDALNRLLRATDHLGGFQLYTYDDVGNVQTARDKNGHLTEYNYDALDRRIERIDALDGRSQWTYDAEGFVLTFADETSHVTTYAYNDRHWLASVTDPAGKVQTYGYDDTGNRTHVTDELNRTTTFQYDGLDRVVTMVEPLGATTVYTYDAVGNRTSMTDPLLRTTSYEYDLLNRLVQETDPRNAVTSYTYDAASNLMSLTDPANNTTTWVYDLVNRLIEERDPLQHSTFFAYDPAGNLIRRTDRNSRVTEYAYDALDRRASERWLTGGIQVRELVFSYDAEGNLLTASDPDSAYTFAYDVLDRVSTVSNFGTPGVPTIVITSGYDAAGRRTSVGDNLGVTVGSNYDSRGLLERRTWQGGGLDAARIDFRYNDAGQRTELERFSDLSSANRIGRTTYGYDPQGRENDIVHRDAVDAVLADYDYLFDLADQLASETHHGQMTSYTHDEAGQLTAADHALQADESYAYDANGNRTGGGYVTGSNNQVLSSGTFNYSYDNAGSLAAKTEIASGNVTTFTYDHRNRLTAVVERSSGGAVVQETSFTYDVFDRRIGKSVDLDGAGPLAAQTIRFVYDGEQVWADFDGSGNLVARYLFGDQTDEILARFRPGEGIAWYLTDHLGTVRDLVGSSGELIDHLEYDSFGSVIVETQPAYGDRFKFTGRELDPETGLYYYRARFFDPALGRFVSQDPIGFIAGDPNLYRYVHNSPLTATDPTGETAVVEYLANIGRGPVGTFIANASFNCAMGELTMWSLGQLAAETFFGKQQPTTHDGISLGIGVVGCAVLGISAKAQVTFLLIAESIHMHFQLRDGSANGLDVALMLLGHAGGLAGSIRGGSGLSEHSASIKTSIKNFLADESGSLRIPGARTTTPKHIRRNIKDIHAWNDIEDFLGQGAPTGANPFTGLVDADRIFVQQADGSWRSVRMGSHEMRNPNDFHYHLEAWDSSGNMIRPDQSVHVQHTSRRS
jgi:RHS repeat-associated protein